MKNLQNLKGTKALSKEEQLSINGGNFQGGCFGTGTGGASSVGFAEACISHPGEDCTINGYAAACVNNTSGGFWFY